MTSCVFSSRSDSMSKRIYLDYAASRLVDPRVLKAMAPYQEDYFGNPSSTHSLGSKSKEAVEKARERIANFLTSKPSEIIFTSGATESINLALQGVCFRNRTRGKKLQYSAIEHMAVINTSKYLTRLGFEASIVPVDHFGVVDLDELKKMVSERTLVVSVMMANGEIGTIQPINAVAEIVHQEGSYLHVDAVAAEGQMPLDVNKIGADLLSLSSNDLYGPKGVGALYIREGTKLEPIIQGGGQERGLRSGTENIPSIVGMAAAAEIAQKEMDKESFRLKKLRDRLIQGILETVKETYLNGHPSDRLPNNANLRFSYVEGESLILSLDMEGIQASSGSACTSKTLEPSHVLMAIGLKHEEAHGSLAFTLGRNNTIENIDYVIKVLPPIVKRLRMMSPLTPKNFVE
jgi:cysteine desulfurase